MSNEPVPFPTQPRSEPTCPYCGARPLIFNKRDMVMPAKATQPKVTVSIFWCANPDCERTISIQELKKDMPDIVGASSMPKGPLIVEKD